MVEILWGEYHRHGHSKDELRRDEHSRHELSYEISFSGKPSFSGRDLVPLGFIGQEMWDDESHRFVPRTRDELEGLARARGATIIANSRLMKLRGSYLLFRPKQ